MSAKIRALIIILENGCTIEHAGSVLIGKYGESASEADRKALKDAMKSWGSTIHAMISQSMRI